MRLLSAGMWRHTICWDMTPYYLLGCDAMYCGRNLLKFRRSMYDLFWKDAQEHRLLSKNFSSPRQFRSTNAPYSYFIRPRTKLCMYKVLTASLHKTLPSVIIVYANSSMSTKEIGQKGNKPVAITVQIATDVISTDRVRLEYFIVTE